LLPQITYYVWALAQWQKIYGRLGKKPTIVVPSGNFGNLTAAVYARWLGTPIQRFIAATNSNDVVPEYFQTGVFIPRPSVQTYSNAMDVGNPSNLARLQSLYGSDVQAMKKDIQTCSVSDSDTLNEIKQTYEQTKYILDPHTAVGVHAARTLCSGEPVIVASTAHPAKFLEVIEKATGVQVPIPVQLQEAMTKTKLSTKLPVDFSVWREHLISGD